MSDVVEARTLTDAVIGLLTDAGLVIGDGDKAHGAEAAGWQGAKGQSDFDPYGILHPIPGGLTEGTIGSPNDDAEVLYQFTGIGGSRAQAEWVGDVARNALTDQYPLVDGVIARITIDYLGGCRRDDTVNPPVWITGDRFAVHTTPDNSGS